MAKANSIRLRHTNEKNGSVISSCNSSFSINNTHSPISNGDTKLKFDFSLYRPFSIKIKTFTNYYSNQNDYVKTLQSFFDLVLHFSDKTKSEILAEKKHSHKIEGDKLKLVEGIIDKYNIDFSVKNLEFTNYYQLGETGSLRIIGVFETNDGNSYFYPLFSDPHHLIYPDIKHIYNDTGKYDYCNAKKNIDSSNISIIDINNTPCEMCYTCEHI